MKKQTIFLLLPVVLLMGAILYAADIPYLTGRITDNAQLLSPDARELLTERMKAHEELTGNQIAVLTIPTIGDESIEAYASEVFTSWKLGQKGKDNGILIVVVPNDRRMRIEVGYGLEGEITDGMAGQIIRTEMTPKFQAGDFDGGIAGGVGAVIEILEGGMPPREAADSGSGKAPGFFQMEGPDIPIKERILLGAFIFGILGVFTAIGVMGPGFGWFLYFFLIPFWATFPMMILGPRGAFNLFIIYVIGFPAAKLFLRKTKWYKKAQKALGTKGRASIGGFSVRPGGSGRSWSSGGSGFSGGGGSSGGGGASGSW